MYVKVKSLRNQTVFLPVDRRDSFFVIKQKISEALGVVPENQRIVLPNGKSVEDEATVEIEEIPSESIIYVLQRIGDSDRFEDPPMLVDEAA